eukprot:TRINITY_DN51745_c0_g1_i1.p1 TRINITY_DN51745_c0_g1~~TRINITY_DN51745_c0_g1_i1.p1  ORF type:complete len:827 (-),score=79.76 TRINITY_DN51745_c0_g1_i1:164-2449(-)
MHSDIVTQTDCTKIWLRHSPALAAEGHRLQTTEDGLIISGGSEQAILYGVYTLCEKLGIRFTLEGDIIPHGDSIPLLKELPHMDTIDQPVFPIRGLQPFHDFAEGPDWWDAQKWKSVMTQISKLKMNFIGIHTYPTEPAVWIGLPSWINKDGTVKQSYSTTWLTTIRDTDEWGYQSKATSNYTVGSGVMFDADCFGTPAMTGGPKGFCYPKTPQEDNIVFNRVGQLWNDTFSWAKKVGVKTAIGTNTPIPHTVPGHTTQEVYEGVFERIMRTHPLDYYWVWTPEEFEWKNISVTSKEWKDTVDDITAAINAAKKLNVPFGLATSGWQLGPRNARTALDKALPGNFPLGALSRDLGREPTDVAYKNITRHAKWTIPWMEDDPGLTSSELWVNRTLEHAREAHKFGVTGFLGIHWRTNEVLPSVWAVAKSSWQLSTTDASLYGDFCTTMFGFGSGTQNYTSCLDSFLGMDSWINGPLPENRPYGIMVKAFTKIPRPVDWDYDGPGGIKANTSSMAVIKERYKMVFKFLSLEPHVSGVGNAYRFGLWANQFRFMYDIQIFEMYLNEFDTEIAQIRKLPAQKQHHAAKRFGLPLLNQLARQWEVLVVRLQSFISSSGELGTLANIEQRSFPETYEVAYKALSKFLPEGIPASHRPTNNWIAPSRLFMLTTRTVVGNGESVPLEAIVGTSEGIGKVMLHHRAMGSKTFTVTPMQAVTVGRGVYRAVLVPTADFEYYITAEVGTAANPLVFPPQAQVGKYQTVVVAK